MHLNDSHYEKIGPVVEYFSPYNPTHLSIVQLSLDESLFIKFYMSNVYLFWKGLQRPEENAKDRYM